MARRDVSSRLESHVGVVRRLGRAGLGGALVALGLAACSGHIGGSGEEAGDAPGDAADETAAASSAMRRLSVHELENTLWAVTGAVPEAINRLPPDGLGHSFDRVVQTQTMSPAHLEAYQAIASEVATTLIGEARLDELVSGCPDASVPSLVQSENVTIHGKGLGLSPQWAVTTAADPNHASTIYAADVQASYSHAFDPPGSYDLRFDLTIAGPVDTATLLVDGTTVATAANLDGKTQLGAEVEIAEAGTGVITLELDTDPDDDGLEVVFESLSVEGPKTASPQPAADEVAACARSIVDELAPAAYRRPLADQERARLLSVYDGIASEHTSADALSSLLEAIFSSPHFLYLVEIGEPVEGREGVHRLGPWELASRLSYAICEQPPDQALWNAAASGELDTREGIEAQARRLFDQPCARKTVERFFEHWLWLNELPELMKSPDVFPKFDQAVVEGMIAETEQLLTALVWNDEATLEELFSAGYGYPTEATAPIYGVPGAGGEATELPGERAGILTSLGVLAVTGTFDGTSPVRRGVYVLEQVLCAELPPPPDTLEIVPPPPDPGLTTRERWDAHSSEPACASCHEQIDPVGFALEGFDGMGRFRTEENGHPVDTSGGVPTLGVEDGAITGGAELAEVLASSTRLKQCAATQWLRFAFGRLNTPADGEAIDRIATAFAQGSMREALVSIVTTDAFLHRIEGSE